MSIQTTNNAVIYCRVSTKEQVEEGNSLITQEKQCKEYALKHGYLIVETFIEQGESAKTANRPELQRLLNYCSTKQGHNVSAVITYKIDRVARNTEDYIQIKALLRRYGVEIKSTSEYFENTPAGKFLENIIANVAQFDNDVRTERTVGGMKEAVFEGRYIWPAPLGYSNTKISGKATITKNEMAPIIHQLFLEVAKNNMPIEEIRRSYNNRRLLIKRNKLISRSQFYRLLKNELYAGWIVKFGERHKGYFKPIVEQDLFDQVQRVLKYRKRYMTSYLVKNPDFPLRRFIYSSSGNALTGSWSKGRRKLYAYYRFHNPKSQFKKEYLESKFIELLNDQKIPESEFDTLIKHLKNHHFKRTKENRDEKSKVEKRIAELKKKQTLLIEKNYQGVIADDLLKQQLDLIDQELLDLNATLLTMPGSSEDIPALLENGKEYILNPGNVWEKATFEIKQRLQWFYFTKGLQAENIESKTTKKAIILKGKSDFFDLMWRLVTHMHKFSNTLDSLNNEDVIVNLWNFVNEQKLNKDN